MGFQRHFLSVFLHFIKLGALGVAIQYRASKSMVMCSLLSYFAVEWLFASGNMQDSLPLDPTPSRP